MTQPLSPSDQNTKPSALRLTEFGNKKSTSHTRLKVPPATEPVPAPLLPRTGVSKSLQVRKILGRNFAHLS